MSRNRIGILSRLGLIALALMAVSLAMPIEARSQQDPVQLLRTSVTEIDTAETLSVDFIARVHVVMGEKEQLTEAQYLYGKRAGGEFFFRPNSAEMTATQDGVMVRGNGRGTLTHIPSLRKHMIQPSDQGIKDFVRSSLSRGIGNGLGGLALSILTEETAEDVIASFTASEFVAEEELDGVATQHCRYTIDNDLTIDVWFSTGDNPRPLRLQPDLTAMSAQDPAAQQYENFKYEVMFDFSNWNTELLAESEYFVNEPAGSELVFSFFGRSQRSLDDPHPLLGKQAPAVGAVTLEGDQVNLADHFGKDVVLLDFWATWCPPCIAAMPRIERVAESFADRGVVFYAVNQQEPAEQVTQFFEARDLSPPTLLDAGEMGNAFGVQNLPTTVILGKDGTVQSVYIGFSGSLEDILGGDLEALVAGEDLAAKKIEKQASKIAAKQAELDQLKQLIQN